MFAQSVNAHNVVINKFLILELWIFGSHNMAGSIHFIICWSNKSWFKKKEEGRGIKKIHNSCCLGNIESGNIESIYFNKPGSYLYRGTIIMF